MEMKQTLCEVTLEAATDEERREHPRCERRECNNAATVKLCFSSADSSAGTIPPGSYKVFICELCAAEIEASAATN